MTSSGIDVSVKSFNAKGDGVTDDTAAIQNAIAAIVTKGGGTVYFPPGKYVIQPNQIKISADNVYLKGSTRASSLRLSAVGTAIRGGKDAEHSVQSCGIFDLDIAWNDTDGTHVHGSQFNGSVGLDATGFRQSMFDRMQIAMPLSARVYGVKMSPVKHGPYYNQFNSLALYGSAFTKDPTPRGSAGIYLAYDVKFPRANANTFRGTSITGFDYGIWVEYGSGNQFLDTVSQVQLAAHVKLGGAVGVAVGTNVDFSYVEAVNTAYVLRLEPGSDGNRIRVVYWNNQTSDIPSQGVTINGLIDPRNSPIVGSNVVEYQGASHGSVAIYTQPAPGATTQNANAAQLTHYNTADRYIVLPDIGGTTAMRARGQADSAAPDVATLKADFNKLLAKLRITGVIDSYTPESDGAICWLRADQGIVRSGTPSTWTDGIGGVAFTAHGSPAYHDFGQLTAPSPRNQPYLLFNGARMYFTGTLGAAVMACSIFVVGKVGEVGVGANYGIVEITPAGTINTGVSLLRLNPNDTARRLSDDASLADSGAGSAGTSWCLFEATYANAAGNIWINGASNGNSGNAVALAGSRMVCIGALGNGSSYFLNGVIAEVIIFPSAVSSGVRSNVHSYVQSRYGLP